LYIGEIIILSFYSILNKDTIVAVILLHRKYSYKWWIYSNL